MNASNGTASAHSSSFLKETLLLAVAFFFMTAPTPDAATLAEMTGNFLIHARVF